MGKNSTYIARLAQHLDDPNLVASLLTPMEAEPERVPGRSFRKPRKVSPRPPQNPDGAIKLRMRAYAEMERRKRLRYWEFWITSWILDGVEIPADIEEAMMAASPADRQEMLAFAERVEAKAAARSRPPGA